MCHLGGTLSLWEVLDVGTIMSVGTWISVERGSEESGTGIRGDGTGDGTRDDGKSSGEEEWKKGLSSI